MTISADPLTVSGKLLSIDDRQRAATINTLLDRRKPTLIAATEEFAAALGTSVIADGEQIDADTVLVAVGSGQRPLPTAIADRLVAHAAAAGAVIVDTTPDDPLRERLADSITAELVQYTLDAAALVPPTDLADSEFDLKLRVPPAADLARRIMLFSGIEQDKVVGAIEAHVLAEPNQPIDKLYRRIDELERINRKLAQEKLGIHDAATARHIKKMEKAEDAINRYENMTALYEEAVFHAKQNDEFFQKARQELHEMAFQMTKLEARLNRYRLAKKLAERTVTTGRRLIKR